MITSRDNARLKKLRRLRRDRRFRQTRAEGLLEGVHLLEAALEAGVLPDAVFATPSFLEAQPVLAGRLPVPPTVVDPALLDELADSDSPRGILASVPLRASAIQDALGDAFDARPILAVDRLQDPGNLGALARVAEAAGVAALVLTPGTVDWRHPRALRASTGSLLRLPVVEDAPLQRVRASLEDQLGAVPPWIGLAPRGGIELWEDDALRIERAVLVVGSESDGLGGETQAALDWTVTLPMAPTVESINVTSAAAVVLFELDRRRRCRRRG